MPDRWHADIFCAQCGVRTPAGYGISRGSPCGIGSKGANQKSHPAHVPARRLPTLNLIQIKTHASGQAKKLRRLGRGEVQTLTAGRVRSDGAIRGFRDRKPLILEPELRQAYDAFVHPVISVTQNIFSRLVISLTNQEALSEYYSP